MSSTEKMEGTLNIFVEMSLKNLEMNKEDWIFLVLIFFHFFKLLIRVSATFLAMVPHQQVN
jgi:hypothetical protein